MSFSGCPVLNLIPTNWANKGVQGLPGAFFVTFCAYKKLPGSGLGKPGQPRAASDLFGSTQVCDRKGNAAAGGRKDSLGWGGPGGRGPLLACSEATRFGAALNAAAGGKNSLVPGEISLWLQKQPRIFVENSTLFLPRLLKCVRIVLY